MATSPRLEGDVVHSSLERAPNGRWQNAQFITGPPESPFVR
jgi:hypothetical protein